MTSLYSSTMTTANFSMAQAIGASNTNNDSHANGQCLMFLTGTALTLGLYLSVLQSTADSTTWIIERISDSQYVLAANAVATSNLLVDSDIDLATANKRIKTSNPVNPTDAVNLQYFQTNGVGGTPT